MKTEVIPVKRKRSLKITAVILGGVLTVLFIMLLTLPALNKLCAVTVSKTDTEEVTQAPSPAKPEQTAVTAYYVMEEGSKKISRLYTEVFRCGSGEVFYLEIPADTKVDLSEELYKSLQSYGPELPQHLKLANMAEFFSEEYGLAAANRILSEVLGISVTEYVRTPAEAFDKWIGLLKQETAGQGFFEEYAQWIAGTSSSRTDRERWAYYESRCLVAEVVTEEAPGSREKDGYIISGKRSGERLEEWIRGAENGKEEEN